MSVTPSWLAGRPDTHAATTCMPCPGARWISRMSGPTERASPMTTVRWTSTPRARRANSRRRRMWRAVRPNTNSSGTTGQHELARHLCLRGIGEERGQAEHRERRVEDGPVLLVGATEVAALVAVRQGQHEHPGERHQRRDAHLVRRGVQVGPDHQPRRCGRGARDHVERDRRPAVAHGPRRPWCQHAAVHGARQRRRPSPQSGDDAARCVSHLPVAVRIHDAQPLRNPSCPLPNPRAPEG